MSLAAGERVLLPAVREAPKTTLVVADGFSCRSQIEQRTDRRALHLSQVLRLARWESRVGPRPEVALAASRLASQRRSLQQGRAGLGLLFLVAAGAVICALTR